MPLQALLHQCAPTPRPSVYIVLLNMGSLPVPHHVDLNIRIVYKFDVNYNHHTLLFVDITYNHHELFGNRSYF